MRRQSAILLIATAVAFAASPVEPVNKDGNGVALKGYDPVAYFKQQKPVPGLPEYSYSWMGAVWQFASAGNRDAFVANPDRYAPRFGGYCAWAVSHGYTADVDPRAWKIAGDKLYLNYNDSVQKKWELDMEKWIEAGERNWPTLHK